MKLLAQKINNPILDKTIKGLSGPGYFNRALPFIIRVLLLVGFLIFLIYFILGSFNWITSQGDKNKLEKAKSQLTNGLIGLLLMFSVFAVIRLIGYAFGLSLLENLQITLPEL